MYLLLLQLAAASPTPAWLRPGYDAHVQQQNLDGTWTDYKSGSQGPWFIMIPPDEYVFEIAQQPVEDWYRYGLCATSDVSASMVRVEAVLNPLGFDFEQIGTVCTGEDYWFPRIPGGNGERQPGPHVVAEAQQFLDAGGGLEGNFWYSRLEDTAASSGVSTSQLAGVTETLTMKKIFYPNLPPRPVRTQWRVILNGVDFVLKSEKPATTEEYATDVGALYVDEVLLHELMHVLGADHFNAGVASRASGGNGGYVSTIMASPRCEESPGQRGATAYADTANYPSEQGGELFLPQAEHSYLYEYFPGKYQAPPLALRLISWYPYFDENEDALDGSTGGCIKYLPLNQVDESILTIPNPGTLVGCPGDFLEGSNGDYIGWYAPVVDQPVPEDLATAPVPPIFETSWALAGTADGLAAGHSYVGVPSSGPTTSKTQFFIDDAIYVDDDASLMIWNPSLAETSYRRLDMIDPYNPSIRVPTTLKVKPPMECPDPLVTLPPPYPHCCPTPED